MKFENISIYNFENAIRGMRNPLNSWGKSDSTFGIYHDNDVHDIVYNYIEKFYSEEELDEMPEEDFSQLYNYYANNIIIDGNPDINVLTCAAIGPEDMRLAQSLIRGGPEHRKFLRQIFISVDITAPLYWQIFCQ